MAEVYGEINMDVAMQSTSEEILEKVEDIHAVCGEDKELLSALTTITKTGTTTLIDITGSGALYSFNAGHLYAAKSNNVWIKITIDGEVYLYWNGKNTDASYNKTVGIAMFAIGFQRFYSSGSYYMYCFPAPNGAQTVYINGSIVPLKCGETSLSFAYSPLLEYSMINPLRFNESLKIEVYQSTNSATGYSEIRYYLD